jgi:hypothetical protein
MFVMRLHVSVLAAAMVAGSPAFADMIAASPDVTLTEAAQAKFNRDTRGDDQVVTPVAGSSGIPAPLYSAAGVSPDEGWTLQQVAAAKFDRDGNGQGGLLNRTSGTTASLAYGQERDYSQLARAAGLSPEEAASMSFDEIANAKLNAEH